MFDAIIIVASVVLGLGSLIEVVMLKNIYSKMFRTYIGVAAALFISIALDQVHWIFHYILAASTLSLAAFKVYLVYLVSKNGKSLQQQKYLADINLTTFLIGQKIKDVTDNVDDEHKQFVFQSGTTKNGLLKIHYDGTILYVNKTFADYLDTTVQELTGKNYLDYLKPQDKEDSEKIWAEKKGGILYGFVNHWVVNGKEYEMRWYTCENRDDLQIAECVLHVWP